jgi:glycosyltransferase involved in cell wall biosynthesis
MAKQLALVIPTYGRSKTVDKLLREMIAEAYALDVEIYYSDDTLDDSVEIVVREVSKHYPNVHYRRNTPSLGHDQNIIDSLLWPETDFVWLIGDSIRPRISELDNVLSFLRDQDFIFLNRLAGAEKNINFVAQPEIRNFVREKLWNQTLTGATIYGRRVRDFVRQHDFKKLPNFPHLSVILEYATIQYPAIGWISNVSIEYSQKPSSYWEDRALEVFVDDWARVIEAYPLIVPHDKLYTTLRSHSRNTNIFSLRRMLSLRSKGIFGTSAMLRPYFWQVMHLNPLIIRAVAMMPSYLACNILSLEQWIKTRVS